MTSIEGLQQQVQALSREEFAQFRDWLLEKDWAAWDPQFEEDVHAGRLDPLAEQALRAHAERRTTDIKSTSM